MSSSPDLILYTNHHCPWAHRAHVALAELNIPFKEEIVDLDKPRTEEYLKINPRGLVPALSYNGEIITESAIVAQFLADAFPSHLLPPSNTADGALRRARISFFVDAFFTKVFPAILKCVSAETDEARAEVGQATTDAIVKEVEPLLADAAPFFGGSEKPTLAEVQTGSWIIRLFAFIKLGYLPTTLAAAFSEKAPNFAKWADAVVKIPSVRNIFSEEHFEKMLEKRYKPRKD